MRFLRGCRSRVAWLLLDFRDTPMTDGIVILLKACMGPSKNSWTGNKVCRLHRDANAEEQDTMTDTQQTHSRDAVDRYTRRDNTTRPERRRNSTGIR